MSKIPSRHMVDLLFTLALFCAFAGCALMVVIMGANVYSKGVDSMQSNFDVRTSISYIAAKLRQGDEKQSIHCENLGTIPALTLDKTINGTTYRTWIYSYEGALCEVFTLRELPISPSEGQRIMELNSLTPQKLSDNLFKITVEEANGHEEVLFYSPRC